jgi:hypothetical protein
MRAIAMSTNNLNPLPADNQAPSNAVRRIEAVRRDIESGLPERPSRRHTDPDQLAHDFAEIERAAAALRRAEPALEAWSGAPRNPAGNPRSVWLLISALWLSSMLVTAGAVVAIASFVG